MKKWMPCFIAAIVFLAGTYNLPAAQEATAASDADRPRMSIGANFLYTWWRPAWESTKINRVFVLGNINPKINPAVIFGLTGSVRFNESWGLSLMFTYGEFDLTVQKYFPVKVPIKPKFETKAQLFEVDVRACHTLHPYVKFFAGARYRGQIASIRYLESYSFRPHHGGLEAGFTFILPLAASFYFVPEVSGMILGGQEKRRPTSLAGCAASGSFGYRVPSSGLNIVVGGRYRYLAYISRRDPYYNNNSDQQYGVTMSLLFAF